MALITGAPKPSEPSRFEIIKNGGADKIFGYDDGECLVSERPEGYYIKVPMGNELDNLETLNAANIF